MDFDRKQEAAETAYVALKASRSPWRAAMAM